VRIKTQSEEIVAYYKEIAVVFRSRGHKAVWKLAQRLAYIWTLLLRITWLQMELHFTIWISVRKQYTVC